MDETMLQRYLIPMTLPQGTIFSDAVTGETRRLDVDTLVFFLDSNAIEKEDGTAFLSTVWYHIDTNPEAFSRPVAYGTDLLTCSGELSSSVVDGVTIDDDAAASFVEALHLKDEVTYTASRTVDYQGKVYLIDAVTDSCTVATD